MSKNICSLILGVILGAALGVLVCDETKKKVKRALCDKAKELQDNCETPIKEGLNSSKNKVKSFIQEHLGQ